VGTRLSIEEINEIRRAFASGLGMRAVARTLGISRDTAAKFRPSSAKCLCGKPPHAGLCKAVVTASPGIISLHRRRKGIDDGYRAAPKKKSRYQKRQEKRAFIFGLAPNWREFADPPHENERYGIIGEVHHATRRIVREYREDVRHEMILACFEGRLARNEIAPMAKLFLWREMNLCLGSQYSGFVSLDAPCNDGDEPKTYLDLLCEGVIDADDIWEIPTSDWWDKPKKRNGAA
jgi:hypothetical protein